MAETEALDEPEKLCWQRCQLIQPRGRPFMHIAVVGGGVVGMTTAYELDRRGHQVTVVERHGVAGNETSKGNAAQRSYGVVYPWADPAMVPKAIPWLLKQDGPLKMAMPPSLDTLRFMFSTLRYAWSPGLFGLNKRAMLRLGIHSRERFAALEQELDPDFDGDHRGLLHLASSPEALAGYRGTQELLNELGISSRLLTPAQVREAEPGMTGNGPLHGALSYDTDGTGDDQPRHPEDDPDTGDEQHCPHQSRPPVCLHSAHGSITAAMASTVRRAPTVGRSIRPKNDLIRNRGGYWLLSARKLAAAGSSVHSPLSTASRAAAGS